MDEAASTHKEEFYGTTENAVKIQVYATITTYCLVSYHRDKLAEEMTTYEVLKSLVRSFTTDKDATETAVKQLSRKITS